MLKVGFRSSVGKAVLKMKTICNMKLACPLFCWAYFLVVVTVGSRGEYSLQIMWWVGNAEVSSIWKHFILTNYLSCDIFFYMCFTEWVFKSIILNMYPLKLICSLNSYWYIYYVLTVSLILTVWPITLSVL